MKGAEAWGRCGLGGYPLKWLADWEGQESLVASKGVKKREAQGPSVGLGWAQVGRVEREGFGGSEG